MPTFLDIGLLNYVQVIFPFILVWVVVYSVLQWREVLGKNQSLHSIIALVLAIMTVLSQPVVALIQYMAPWFVMLLVLSLFIILFLRFFGVSDSAIKDAFEKSDDARFLTYWIIVISVIVFAGAVGKVFFAGQSVYVGGETGAVLDSVYAGNTSALNVATASGEANFAATLFHPKVLGMLFILIVAAFTIKLLSGDVIPAVKK